MRPCMDGGVGRHCVGTRMGNHWCWVLSFYSKPLRRSGPSRREWGLHRADKRRRPLEFEAGDHVFLRVTPIASIGRAIKLRKLTPRFVGPYQILRRIGVAAYEIAIHHTWRICITCSTFLSWGNMLQTRRTYWSQTIFRFGRIWRWTLGQYEF